MKQQLIKINESYDMLRDCIIKSGEKQIFLVCGKSIEKLRIYDHLKFLKDFDGIEIVRFSAFSPNPEYDDIVEGVKLFRKSNCRLIFAVGGGSAIDTAKCIKAFSGMNDDKDYISQEILPSKIKLVAMPTTAGSGSEATRFAVLYYKGEKQSLSSENIIPDIVVLDPSVLLNLPLYHKKASMFDALCHCIESYWSVNSTDESKSYVREAAKLILENENFYINDILSSNILQSYISEVCTKMQEAAYLAGKAINITQTTAGHAMSYKITKIFGIAHGHAAALCVSKLWGYMIDHTDLTTDKRGKEYLNNVFAELADIFGVPDPKAAVRKFTCLLSKVGLSAPEEASMRDIDILKKSVNPVRLKNNPITLNEDDFEILYKDILNIK